MRRVSRPTSTDSDDRHHTDVIDPRIATLFRRWAVISARVEELEDQKQDIRPELLSYAEHHGKADAKGHQHVDLDVPIQMPGGKTFLGFTREKRVSRALNEERTRALAEAKGLTSRIFRQEVITILDTDELYAAHQEGLLTDEELDGLIDTTIKHALKGR